MKKKNNSLALAVFLALALFASPGFAWLSGYDYRLPVNISTSTNITNVPVNFTINFSSGMNADFAYLNITNSTDGTLNFWIENYTASTAAHIWVNASINIANGTQIYVYFGKPGTSGSNKTNVFIEEINNLAGAWTFDEIGSATTYDKSGYGANLTLQNAAIINAGRYGGAMNITAAKGNASVVSMSQLQITQNITIVGWIYQPSTVSSYYVLASKGYTKEFDAATAPQIPRTVIYRNGAQKYQDTGSFAGPGWNNFVFVADSSYTFTRVNKTALMSTTGITGSSGTLNFTVGMRSDDPSISTPVGTLYDDLYIFNASLGNTTLDRFYDYKGYPTPNNLGKLLLGVNNKNVSSVSVGTVEDASAAITITITAPSTIIYYTSYLNLTYNATGKNNTFICNHSIGSNYSANYNVDNATIVNASFVNLSEGSHTITVNCSFTNATGTYNASSSVTPVLDLYNFTASFSNYTTYNSTTYGHTIVINYTASCAEHEGTAYVNITLNGTVNQSQPIACNTTPLNYIKNISAPGDGNYTIAAILFKINSTQDSNSSLTYRSDITAPNATFNYNLSGGFNITSRNVNISVNDTISPYVLCNISINNVAYSNVNFSNNQSNYTFNISDGYNNFTATCWDIVNNSVSISNSTYFYLKKIVLIYEDDGTNLSANNLTNMSIRAISENYDTIFSFNAYNITYMWILSNESDTYRIEKVYNAYPNELFFIDLNLGLISESEIPVCVSSLQTLYEILFYSSTEKPVVVTNTLADCYVLAEYTEYAYQDAYMAKAYTIKAKYQLYTYDDGLRVLLAAVDGSLATTIALDVLEFSKTTYNLGALTEEVSINGMGNSTVKIYYQNQNNNSDSTSISIYNGSTLIWSYTETLQPNNITLYFDYSTLGLTSNDLMRLVLVRTTDGVQTTITKIFNLQGSTGLLTAPLAIFLGLIILFFGLTISASNRTFGFFGVGFTLIALAITTLAVPDAPLRLFQAILIITLIFIGFIWKEENITIT